MTANDEPTLVDALERGGMIREIGAAIADGTPPLVLGVHGDWGIGKTSALQQLQFHLSGDCPHAEDEQVRHCANAGLAREDKDRFVTVLFEAWRYQYEPVPVVALLHEIRGQLDWWAKARNLTKKSAIVSLKAALEQIDSITGKIGFQGSKAVEQWSKYDRDQMAVDLPAKTIRDLLNKAIGDVLGVADNENRGEVEPTRRLVILIDDLDRCESEMAYRLLEGIKIYLGLNNCVFVLGMNQNVVEEAIAKNLAEGNEAPKHIRAEAYMEKLCQNVWRLPSVRRPDTFLDAHIGSTPEFRQRVTDATTGLVNWLPPNPRKLKGYANLLNRMAGRLDLDSVKELGLDDITTARMLLVVAYVYHSHHKLYVRWEASETFWDEIKVWATNSGQPSEEDYFKGYILPYKNESPGEDAPGEMTLTSRHPDPTLPTVFWIQPIVFELNDAVTAEQFRPFMDGV
jgi:hypothetical protein